MVALGIYAYFNSGVKTIKADVDKAENEVIKIYKERDEVKSEEITRLREQHAVLAKERATMEVEVNQLRTKNDLMGKFFERGDEATKAYQSRGIEIFNKVDTVVPIIIKMDDKFTKITELLEQHMSVIQDRIK